MNKKKQSNDLMGKIPNYFTLIGILLSILSISSLIYAIKILFY